MSQHSQYTIYILECSNGAYYTGYTTDLERRYQEHLDGTAKCKFTRSFRPQRIAASWTLPLNISQALKLERAIKRLSREQKLELIAEPQNIMGFVEQTNLTDQ